MSKVNWDFDSRPRQLGEDQESRTQRLLPLFIRQRRRALSQTLANKPEQKDQRLQRQPVPHVNLATTTEQL